MQTKADPQFRSSAMGCGRLVLVTSALAIAALVVPLGAEAPAPATLRETLARGLVAEEVNRDLETARRDYEAVLAGFTDQRAVAASALFRLAEIHRAQGRRDEAVAHYQRLLREFPDAERERDLARRQLAEWQVAPAADAPARAALNDEEAALRRLRQLRQSSPDVFRQAENELEDAITKAWPRVLEYLLEEGHDPDRALIIASEQGNLEAVRHILARPEQPGAGAVYEAVLKAVANEYDAVFGALLAAGLDLDYQPDAKPNDVVHNHGTVLHTLMSPNALEQVRGLIDAGADVNAASRLTGYTPLHIALSRSKDSSGDFTGLVKLLLDKGADVQARTTHRSPDWSATRVNPKASRSALDLAMEANRPELVALLIDRGADAKQDGLLAAACAVPDGLEIARLLLDRGADPNAPAGAPPIIRAFQNIESTGTPNETLARHRHQIALIRLLLERGADPNTLHGTFRREPIRPSNRGGLGNEDFGISLFAPPLENSVELPAGLFHQVMRLYSDHRLLNLELVQDLLDAGAVPKDEFPEIFAFVATDGRSNRRGGGIVMADGEGDPADIARALLAHGPAEIHPENLTRANYWDPGVRRVVLDELIHPPLAASGGVTLSHFETGTQQQILASGEPVPDTATLLFENLGALRASAFTRVRRGPDGTWQRTAIDWQGPARLPDLHAGDIIEMEGDPPNQDLLRWSLQKRLPVLPVTFEIDGRERAVTVRPDLLAFDPARNEVPLLDATALARLLGQGLRADGTPDVLDDATLTLRRDGWPDLKLATGDAGAKPFPLEAGDRLIVGRNPSLPDDRRIALTLPGLPFLRMFDAEGAPTLVQAIADAWSPWREMHANIRPPQDDASSLAWRAAQQGGQRGETYVSVVPRDPDLSKIRIRRKPPGGAESVLAIDLAQAIRDCADDTTPAQARLADVELQAGDIIEIPPRQSPENPPWKGLSPEAVRFIGKVLSARYVVIDASQGVQPREFRYQAPRWIDGPHGLIALPPTDGSPTARYTAIVNGQEFQIQQLLRGGEVVSLSHTSSWFVREGDQATLHGYPLVPSGSAPRPPRTRVIPLPNAR